MTVVDYSRHVGQDDVVVLRGLKEGVIGALRVFEPQFVGAAAAQARVRLERRARLVRRQRVRNGNLRDVALAGEQRAIRIQHGLFSLVGSRQSLDTLSRCGRIERSWSSASGRRGSLCLPDAHTPDPRPIQSLHPTENRIRTMTAAEKAMNNSPAEGAGDRQAVAPSTISKPVSIVCGVPVRSGCDKICSTAMRPIRNRFDRTVDSGVGRA